MASPFAMIPVAVLIDPRLKFRTLKVFGSICSFRKSSSDDCVEVSRDQIASRCGFNASIVSVATTELQTLGWLIKQGAGGRGLKTSYTIMIPQTVPDSETVMESETVLKSETVSENKTVPESVSKTVSTSGTPLYTREKDIDGRFSKPKVSEPEGFGECWSAYPKRDGGNSRSEALKAYRARLKAGASPADLLAGVKRYASYCTSKGIVGSGYVKQAATFFGPGDHWQESWAVPSATPTHHDHQRPKTGDSRTRLGAAETFTENLGWVPA